MCRQDPLTRLANGKLPKKIESILYEGRGGSGTRRRGITLLPVKTGRSGGSRMMARPAACFSENPRRTAD
ncbi:hypothetical protein EMEDMD4_630020 [Sinorhizobium medicae]|uniref:Uncharacterized protein n=1 Tax=Sinorhizobium medicae TaxID=110321 RepID=A0A508X4E1_9HYPH|nr:hypothetical protein EMEDMD4_630020 [Sinorhizobium medicae]